MAAKPRPAAMDRMPGFGRPPHLAGMLGADAAVQDRRGALRRLWGYLGRYRLALAGVLLLVVASTGLSLLWPFLLGRAIDRYIATGNLPGLARLLALMGGVCLLSAAAGWLQQVTMIRLTQRTVRDLRGDLFAKLQTLPLRFFDRHPHGELMSRLTNDTDLVSATLGDAVAQLAGSTLSILGAGVLMLSLNWRLALASMVTFPALLLAMRWVGRKTREGFRARQAALGTLNGLVEETILGQRVVTVCRHQGQAIAQFGAANQALRQSATRALIYGGLMGPMMNVFRNLSFGVLVGVGGWLVAAGLATVGTVAAFLNYGDSFNRPLIQLANLYGTIQSALAGAERVFATIDEAPEPPDAPDAVALGEVRGEVEFDGVCFGYEPETPVLQDVSFRAKSGQTIALVGRTGAGKTTIINLLTRFYDVDRGAIRVDGHDVRQLRKEELRRALGIVLQDTVLFAATVRENIRYGRPDATDREIEAAAELANAAGFIRHLPHGFDTMLSESGNSLSQGQRQLLAIARAMLADPALLILDEATSSVDTRTEVHLQQAMKRLLEGRTSFIIAHRLSTIRAADLILVIEHGRIVERGSHAALLAQEGVYHRLYATQLGVGEG